MTNSLIGSAEDGTFTQAPSFALGSNWSPVSNADASGSTINAVGASAMPVDTEQPLLPSEPKPVHSAPMYVDAVLVEGSKLILTLSRGEVFMLDRGMKVLCVKGEVSSLERSQVFERIKVVSETACIVLDAAGGASAWSSARFIPVNLTSMADPIYTKDGTSHLLVGGADGTRRAKVSGPHLPYPTCNKFSSYSIFEYSNSFSEEPKPKSSPLYYHRSFPSKFNDDEIQLALQNSGVLATPFQPLTEYDASGAMLYIRADDTVLKFDLKVEEECDLANCRLLAWSGPLKFKFKSSIFSSKNLIGCTGPGTVYLTPAKLLN